MLSSTRRTLFPKSRWASSQVVSSLLVQPCSARHASSGFGLKGGADSAGDSFGPRRDSGSSSSSRGPSEKFKGSKSESNDYSRPRGEVRVAGGSYQARPKSEGGAQTYDKPAYSRDKPSHSREKTYGDDRPSSSRSSPLFERPQSKTYAPRSQYSDSAPRSYERPERTSSYSEKGRIPGFSSPYESAPTRSYQDRPPARSYQDKPAPRYNDRESSFSGESYYEKMAREANAELKFDREKEMALVERKAGKAQKFVMEDFQLKTQLASVELPDNFPPAPFGGARFFASFKNVNFVAAKDFYRDYLRESGVSGAKHFNVGIKDTAMMTVDTFAGFKAAWKLPIPEWLSISLNPPDGVQRRTISSLQPLDQPRRFDEPSRSDDRPSRYEDKPSRYEDQPSRFDDAPSSFDSREPAAPYSRARPRTQAEWAACREEKKNQPLADIHNPASRRLKLGETSPFAFKYHCWIDGLKRDSRIGHIKRALQEHCTGPVESVLNPKACKFKFTSEEDREKGMQLLRRDHNVFLEKPPKPERPPKKPRVSRPRKQTADSDPATAEAGVVDFDSAEPSDFSGGVELPSTSSSTMASGSTTTSDLRFEAPLEGAAQGESSQVSESSTTVSTASSAPEASSQCAEVASAPISAPKISSAESTTRSNESESNPSETTTKDAPTDAQPTTPSQ